MVERNVVGVGQDSLTTTGLGNQLSMWGDLLTIFVLESRHTDYGSECLYR